jgi:hypothetical protein
MAGEKEGGAHRGKCNNEVRRFWSFNSEVLPVVPGVEGVHGGVQLEQVKVTVWSEISSSSCNGDDAWLELSAVVVNSRARMNPSLIERNWMRQPYQEM